MLEVSLALVLTALAAVGTLRENARADRMKAADIQADALASYQNALQAYTDENYQLLQAGLAVTKSGVTLAPGAALGQTMQPDIPSLITMGYLPTGFTNQAILVDGAGYANQIQLQPFGCVTVGCNVRGLAYITSPVVVKGSTETDGVIIGQMLVRIGGNAGTSVEGSTATMSSVGGAWTWANPLPGLPAGVVGVRFGIDSSTLGSFVRINDTRDPNLQGPLSVVGNTTVGGTFSVAGATTLNGATTVNANLTVRDAAGNPCVTMDRTGIVTVSCTGTLNAQTGVFTDGAGNTTTIGPTGVVATGRITGTQGLSTATGRVFDAADPNAIFVNAPQMFVRGSSGTLVSFDGGDVVASKNVAGMRMAMSEVVVEGTPCANTSGAVAGAVMEYAALASGGMATCAGGRWSAVGRTGAAGAGCGTPGAYATDPSDGQGLICRNGTYVRTNALLSNFVLAATAGASDGTVLAKPVCAPAGSAAPQPLVILVPGNEDPSVVGGTTVSGINRFAVDNGPTWTAHLQRAADGSSLPGTMIANMYCWYP